MAGTKSFPAISAKAKAKRSREANGPCGKDTIQAWSSRDGQNGGRQHGDTIGEELDGVIPETKSETNSPREPHRTLTREVAENCGVEEERKWKPHPERQGLMATRAGSSERLSSRARVGSGEIVDDVGGTTHSRQTEGSKEGIRDWLNAGKHQDASPMPITPLL